MTVQTIPTPRTTKTLIDPLDNTNNISGFQRAHIVGDEFAKSNELSWFRWILGRTGQNNNVNGVLAPQAQRGGAVLGAAVHRSNHVDAFDSLFFDSSEDGLRDSNKFLNVARRDLSDAIQDATNNPSFDIDSQSQLDALDKNDPAIKDIFERHNRKTGAFLDFAKVLFMHDGVLAKMGFPDLKSLALNGQDVRFADDDAVRSYLRGLDDEGALDYDRLVGDPISGKNTGPSSGFWANSKASRSRLLPDVVTLPIRNPNSLSIPRN
jgi:hypothetical protein